MRTKAAGKWAESGGENAKFGLTTAEMLAATELLKAENLSHCFKLLHFHIGSQVPDILTVKKAVQEAARFYAKLYQMGFAIQYLDVGGGLGVDYDGSRSAFDSSTNYTLQEYTNDIVYYIADVCNAEQVPHPDIVSESGRAIVAHHSVLIVEVFGSIDKTPARQPVDLRRLASTPWSRNCSTSAITWPNSTSSRPIHDALERKEDAHNMFTLGLLDLPDKAKIENLYWEISRRRGPTVSAARPTSPRKSASSKTAWATNTSAISPCSSPCWITGPWASCSPSCPSAASTSVRPAKPPWSTSPAIPTAQSASSSTCATSATPCRSTT